MVSKKRLADYRSKRDPATSGEPTGGRGPHRGEPLFVDGTPVSMAEALDNGHARVWLHGHKLSGAFALTRTKLRGDKRNWLLVKVDDDGADELAES